MKPERPGNIPEYFLKSFWSWKTFQKSNFGPQNCFLNFPIPYFGPQCPQIAVPQPKIGPQCPYLAVPPHIKCTSMSISGGSNRILLDLKVHIWRFQPHIIGPQCPYLAVPTAYYRTSMSMISGGSNRILLDFNVHMEL